MPPTLGKNPTHTEAEVAADACCIKHDTVPPSQEVSPFAQRVLQFAQALSDPIRVRILELLLDDNGCCCRTKAGGDLDGVCVCDLVDNLGLIQSKVSYHLAKLKAAGIICEQKRGKWNYYTVNQQTVAGMLQSCACFLQRPNE